MQLRLVRFLVSAVAVAALVGPWCGVARADGVHVRLDPVNVTLNPGDTLVVSVTVSPADAQFNAFDLVTNYDPSRLTFVPVSPVSKQVGSLVTGACGTLFHLFNANTASGILTTNLSLLCNNVFLSGPGTVYTLKFKAGTTQGTTTVTLGSGSQFYRAGLFVNPLDVTPLTVSIGAVAAPDPRAVAPTGLTLRAPAPNPRRGTAALRVPLSLARDAAVHLALFDSTGRLMAQRPAEQLAAGAHVIRWRAPKLAAGHYTLRATSTAGDTADTACTILP